MLALVAFLAVLVALILPATKWASSGDIRFPVRVFVFDATRGVPIANARVAIFWAPLLSGVETLQENREFFRSVDLDQIRDDVGGVTKSDGTVVIDYKFRTGANHERPITYAHLRGTWVRVQVEGYGGVVVPVRYDSLPTATLREQKELVVPVGLTHER
jgi:hypothetical protein